MDIFILNCRHISLPDNKNKLTMKVRLRFHALWQYSLSTPHGVMFKKKEYLKIEQLRF